MFSTLSKEFAPSAYSTKSELADLEVLDSKLSINDYLSFAKDWLTKQHMDFTVNRERALKYYQFNRGNDFYPNYLIPIGQHDFMPYQGHVLGGIVDRDLSDYLRLIFKDDDEFQEFFSGKKTIAELGSGRAIALMQLSEKFPNATLIGIDNLYREKRKIYPGKEGMQLSFGDWNNLSLLANDSLDTIMSVISVTYWGIPGVGNRGSEEFDASVWHRILAEFYRVLKKGGMFKMSFARNTELLRKNMNAQQWNDISNDTTGFVAIKK